MQAFMMGSKTSGVLQVQLCCCTDENSLSFQYGSTSIRADAEVYGSNFCFVKCMHRL